MFLTPAEIAELTGRRRVASQARALSAMGIRYVLAPDGVRVLRAEVEGRMLTTWPAAREPALRSDAMLARFQAAGGSVQWVTYTDEKVTGIFSHPSGGKIEITWDMTRAKQAGLGAKDNWRKFPRQMLAARCISEGVKRVYPGVAVGTYTPEEVQDFEPRPEREITGDRVDPIRQPATSRRTPGIWTQRVKPVR